MCGDSEGSEPVVSVGSLPATLDGSLIFQIQNAMAATAVAIELNIDPSVIARALRSFLPLPDLQPGSCNILEARGARVVVDSPVQTWTLRMLARGIKHQPHRRSVVVSNCFPSLPVDDVREAGRILGALGGVVLLHNEERDSDRMIAIKSGIALNAVPPLVLAFGSETAAIDQMLQTVGSGDTALILSGTPQMALAQISAFVGG